MLVGHNLKYDYSVIKVDYGIELENLYDTMLAAQLMEYAQTVKPAGYFTLESCVRRWVDKIAYSAQGDLFAPSITKEIRKSFSSIGDSDFTSAQIYYGAYDALYTLLLSKCLRGGAEGVDLTASVNQENEFLKVLADMELNGMPADTGLFLDASKEAEEITSELRLNLLEHKDINWDSPKQVNTVLKELGVDTSIVDKKTGEIKESVGKIVIAKQTAKFPLLSKYIAYKEADKKCKAYGHKFLRHWNPTSGRIHTSFMQLMVTGRTSSSSPNMQNIPRDKMYRQAFRPLEGNVFVAADFSNQEMRVLAELSQDVALLKAVSTSDVHWETAKLIYKDPNLPKDSVERQYAKTINFLMLFGGGPKKLSEAFGLSMAEAKQIIKRYFDTFPGLEPYFHREGVIAKEQGYIVVNEITKRRANLPFWDKYKFCKDHITYFRARGYDIRPEILDTYQYLDSKYQRLAQNYRIQATAADISKVTGIVLRRYAKKFKFKILLLIHDEWILECPEYMANTVKRILEKACAEAVSYFLNIPIPADAGISQYWTK